MATQKQIKANRANAQRSTGPRTEDGKARSRLNAKKHGLTAELLVMGNEDASEFDTLRATLMEQYDPLAPDECELVEYIASSLWPLRRVPLFEAAIFAARHAQVAADLGEEDALIERSNPGVKDREMSNAGWLIFVGRTLIKDGVWNDAFGKLARYETSLLNSLRKAYQLLDERSEKRLSKPETIELTALPSAAGDLAETRFTQAASSVRRRQAPKELRRVQVGGET